MSLLSHLHPSPFLFKYVLYNLLQVIQLYTIITNVLTLKSIFKWNSYFNGKAVDKVIFFFLFVSTSQIPHNETLK